MSTNITIGRVLEKLVGDEQLFTINWSDELQTGLTSNGLTRDRIAESTWALDYLSPRKSTEFGASGFDEASNNTWVTIKGGVEGNVVWINNTIVTTGASINGKTTPKQTFTRQIRVRIK